MLVIELNGTIGHSVYVRKCVPPCCSCADLTKHLVSDYSAISELMDLGNSHRYVRMYMLGSSEVSTLQ